MYDATMLGKRIRHIRRDRDITQRALADAIGISQGALSAIESGGTVYPRTDTLVNIANALQVPVETLLGTADSDSAPPEPAGVAPEAMSAVATVAA